MSLFRNEKYSHSRPLTKKKKKIRLSASQHSSTLQLREINLGVLLEDYLGYQVLWIISLGETLIIYINFYPLELGYTELLHKHPE